MGAKQIDNPAGAHSYTGADNYAQRGAPVVENHVASAAVTAGQIVSIGILETVAPTAVGGSGLLVVGVAQDAMAIGETGVVTTLGPARIVATGAIAAGDGLIRSGTVAGSVVTAGVVDATTVAGTLLGVAVTAAAGGFVNARFFHA